MKNFKNYTPEIYATSDFQKIEEGIYKTKCLYNVSDKGVFVTDFYEQLNETSETICYQEFGSFDLADIQKLRTLIGKRFYAVPYMENGEEYYNMVTE